MWVAAGIVAVAAALVLFAPITIDLRLEGDVERAVWAHRVHVRWLVVSVRAESGRTAAPDPSAQTLVLADVPADRRAAVRRRRALRAALGSPGFTRRVLRLVVDLLRLVRPDDYDVRARIGFDDPAATGLVAAATYACAGCGAAPGVHIELDFSGATLEGQARLRWSRNLAALARPFAGFAVSPAVWRAARAYRRARLG